MRKITWIAALIIALLATGHAAADELEDAVKYCTVISELAGTIMTGRQHNVSMSGMMEILARIAPDEQMKKGITAMIMLAYKQPRYSTEQMQQHAINDYANSTFLSCMQKRQ